MKKKTAILLLTAALTVGMLAGCGKTEQTVAPNPPTSESESPKEESKVESPVATETPVVENHEGMYRSELTNEWIDEALENQRPVAILVDNEKTALDHYGLTQADIVYELMNSTANGEITRFMAIVKDWDSITRFGSIRSVRPTNFMLAPEYNAILIHDGGPFYIDPYVKNPWIDNLSGGFKRIENGKPREFTEYVTTGEIEARLKANKISEEYNTYYQGPHWKFADETAPMKLMAARSDAKACTFIDLPFPHNESELEYDKESNTYLYSEYGEPHIDLENDEKQLAFTNVVLQCAEVKQLDANGYMEFKLFQQSGEGYYITGGAVIPVTWEKGVDYEPTKFYDMSGNEIILNTGKTYVGLVSTTRWDELVLE
jgi:hypothetical protein